MKGEPVYLMRSSESC